MTKKFFSIVLSLVLLIGLLPVMNVSAETTVYVNDGFETYSQSAYNTDFSANTSIYDTGDKNNYNHYWYAAQNMSLEILDMPGPDGKMTKVAEITVNSCGVGTSTNGSTRFRNSSEGLGAGAGVVVQEMDIYIDDNIMNNVYMNPIFIKGKNIGVGDTQQVGHNTLKSVSNGWHHITAVTILDGTEVNSDGTRKNNVIGYVDGKCISYKEYTKDSVSRQFQVYGTKLPGFKTLTIDNVKLYTNPSAATASSGIAGSTGVSTKASPTVNFSESLLKLSSVEEGMISADKNITFVKTEDNTPVEISGLELSEDGKSLSIVPAKDLEKGTSYTVTVKNLKDIYTNNIDAYTFEFTTAEDYKITAEAPVFTKVDLVNPGVASQDIQNLENGYINASYTLNNGASTDTEVMMVAVLKDGDTIEYMQFDTVLVPANGSATYNAGFKVDKYSTQKIEIFAWDSLYGMTPLASKYDISASGIDEVSFDN